MNERDNHLHTAELSEEQNDNMLDGILTTCRPRRSPKGRRKRSWTE